MVHNSILSLRFSGNDRFPPYPVLNFSRFGNGVLPFETFKPILCSQTGSTQVVSRLKDLVFIRPGCGLLD